MNKFREQAKKAHEQILEENEGFLEEVLYPMIDANNANKAAGAERGRGKTVLRRAALVTVPLMLVVISVLTTYFLAKTETPYLGVYESRVSDLTEVNANLTYTKLAGDFDAIVMTYEKKTDKAVRFSVSGEFITQESLINFETELTVDRGYGAEQREGLADSFSHLGFAVTFSETENSDIFGDIPIREFHIRAYLDTGREMYYMTYEETTVNTASGFRTFLENTILKKS